jgi:hypothetical protein
MHKIASPPRHHSEHAINVADAIEILAGVPINIAAEPNAGLCK